MMLNCKYDFSFSNRNVAGTHVSRVWALEWTPCLTQPLVSVSEALLTASPPSYAAPSAVATSALTRSATTLAPGPVNKVNVAG